MTHKKGSFVLNRTALFFAVAFSSLTACTKYDLLAPQIQANPEFAVALSRFRFAFSDFIKGDSLLQVGIDSSITLRYAKDSIASFSLVDMIQKMAGGIAGNVNKSISLGTVSVPNINLAQTVLLSQLGSAFPAPLDGFCMNGGTAPAASGAFSTATSVNSNLPIISQIQSVSFATGTLNLSLTNHFPFSIQNLTIELINTNTGDLVATLPIRNPNNGIEIAAAGGTGMATANLTGKTMLNQLSCRIGTFNSPGVSTGTVFLSTETLAIDINMTNLKMKSGIVKIPAQSIPEDAMVVPLGNQNSDQKFTELTLKNATIRYDIAKTMKVNVNLALTFPTITQNGVPVTEIISVVGASATGSIYLKDAICNLASFAAQPYNQLPVKVAVSVITSGGGFVPVNETDQIRTDVSFINIEIGGAKGKFGNFELDIPATNQSLGADFNFLTPESQRLLFSDPVLRIKTVNSLGLDINTDLLMSATGTLPGTEHLGLAADAGHLKFDIARPTVAQAGTPAQLVAGVKIADKNSSNIVSFMGVLPKSIQSSGKISMRSAGPQVDFFTADSRLKLGLEMEIPIKFSTENLIVRDTMTAFANIVTEPVGKIFEYIALDINYTTRLPLSVTVDLATITETGLKSVVTGILLPASDVIDANGKVTAAKSGTFEVKLTSAQLVELSAAPKVVLVAKLKTAGTGTTPVALYTHYDFDMGIGVRIKTKLGQ